MNREHRGTSEKVEEEREYEKISSIKSKNRMFLKASFFGGSVQRDGDEVKKKKIKKYKEIGYFFFKNK